MKQAPIFELYVNGKWCSNFYNEKVLNKIVVRLTNSGYTVNIIKKEV